MRGPSSHLNIIMLKTLPLGVICVRGGTSHTLFVVFFFEYIVDFDEK